jgi:hypothetical protein
VRAVFRQGRLRNSKLLKFASDFEGDFESLLVV